MPENISLKKENENIDNGMTVFIIFMFIFGFLLADFLLYYYRGNDATVSKTILAKAASSPLIVMTSSYTFGLMLGHFFLITTGEELTTAVALKQLGIALIPTIIGLILLFKVKTVENSVIISIFKNPIVTATVIVIGIILGMMAGHYLIPQHILVGQM